MTTQELDTRYRDLRKKVEETRLSVVNAVLDALSYNPDALRHALGSVGFRRAEECKSYEDQADAAFMDWLASLGA